MASQTVNKNIFIVSSDNDVSNTDAILTGSKTQKTQTSNQEIDNDGFTVVKSKKSSKKKQPEKETPMNEGMRLLVNEARRQIDKAPIRTPTGIVRRIKEQPKEETSIEEFPELGTKLTKEQELDIKYSQHDMMSAKERESKEKPSYPVDSRSQSFALMADKKSVATSLVRTKACRLVVLNPNENKFGVCTRAHCTFAHSEEERQAPMCGFDGNCRFINGKRDRKTGKIIPNSKCKFRHSNETVLEWLNRSGVVRPKLPPTSEHSRKPLNAEKVEVNAKNITASHHNVIKPKVTTNYTDEVNTATLQDIGRSVERYDKSKHSHYSFSDDSSSSDDSFSSDSDDNYHRRRRTSSRKSKFSDKPPPATQTSSVTQVIRVPTKELAAIAIKAAFDRGQYNIQVLVE